MMASDPSVSRSTMTIPAHSFFRSSLFPALADYHINRMRPNQTMPREVGAKSRRVVDRSA